jgi:hypothetical protein
LVSTVSDDGDGMRFSVSLPSLTPRFRYALKTLHDFPEANFLPLLLLLVDTQLSTRKSRWSRVGTSKVLLDFYPFIYLVR